MLMSSYLYVDKPGEKNNSNEGISADGYFHKACFENECGCQQGSHYVCKCVQKPPSSNLSFTFGSCCMVSGGESRSNGSLMSRKLHLLFTYLLF